MPGASLLALLDDIGSVLDDVALLTKLASKKTAGVLGDDLALNAQQVAGVRADRELPVVWAVAKGSLLNKAVLVPSALAISAFAPWGVTPLLMIGGTFLCFEGFEKVAHGFFPHRHEIPAQSVLELAENDEEKRPQLDAAALERQKIRGAIRTDFVLSAEIVTISLGSVANVAFLTQVLVLSTIGIIMTVGVYGVVAALVKLDDFGLYLCTSKRAIVPFQRRLGATLVSLMPWIMKALTVVGTLAMFLVGGGILAHGIPWLHHFDTLAATRLHQLGGWGPPLVAGTISGLVGVLAGALVWGVFTSCKRLLSQK